MSWIEKMGSQGIFALLYGREAPVLQEQLHMRVETWAHAWAQTLAWLHVWAKKWMRVQVGTEMGAGVAGSSELSPSRSKFGMRQMISCLISTRSLCCK